MVSLKGFYAAEGYHQNYAANHPDDLYIRYNDAPKVAHLRQQFPDLYTGKWSTKMFDSLDNVITKRKLGRREFMAAAAAAGLTFGYGWLRRPKLVEAVASEPGDKYGEVKIVQFSDFGKRLKSSPLQRW